jgi:hypothetical protein
VPILVELINKEFREILVNKKISIVFDGASVDGDLVAVIIRYMSGWTLQQKLVNMRHADCTVDNKQLNSILMQTFNNLGVSFIFIRYYSILLSSLFIYLFISTD